MINEKTFMKSIEQELVKANNIASGDVRRFIGEYDGIFSEILRENIEISENMKLPLCQDTGIVEFFVFKGWKTRLDFNMVHVLGECVKNVYKSNPYRFSTVEDPLYRRKNQGENLPAIIHFFETDGEKLEIRFLIKGGGSENLSFLKMMNPSCSEDEITDEIISHIREKGAKSCPPLHVGIGLGGTADKAIVMSKLALTEDFEKRNDDSFYASLENKIKDRLNCLKIGFQGLGNGITAYSVHIKPFPTHIATLPLAITVDCYLCRKGRVEFEI